MSATERPRGRGRKKQSHLAAPQFLGYSLQATRAVVHLLDANEGSVVCVEVLDDVGVIEANGKVLVEQTKSALGSNPVSDRSVDLWKTLATWVGGVVDGTLPLANCQFRLYVSRKHDAPIARSMSSASDLKSAIEVLRSAKAELLGATGKTPNNDALKPYLDTVFDADETLVAGIIERFELQFGGGDSAQEILVRLENVVAPELRSTLANQLLGWTKSRLDECIEKQLPATIAVTDFKSELRSFVQRIDRSLILNSFAPMPTSDELRAELPARTYIRQLDLIACTFEEKLAAANDYLRAAIDRSRWAEMGLVHAASFVDFEDLLKRRWTAKKKVTELQSKQESSQHQGALLFAECMQINEKLQEKAVPTHFNPGCFHALADVQAIGWHPAYETELLSPKMASKGASS